MCAEVHKMYGRNVHLEKWNGWAYASGHDVSCAVTAMLKFITQHILIDHGRC